MSSDFASNNFKNFSSVIVQELKSLQTIIKEEISQLRQEIGLFHDVKCQTPLNFSHLNSNLNKLSNINNAAIPNNSNIFVEIDPGNNTSEKNLEQQCCDDNMSILKRYCLENEHILIKKIFELFNANAIIQQEIYEENKIKLKGCTNETSTDFFVEILFKPNKVKKIDDTEKVKNNKVSNLHNDDVNDDKRNQKKSLDLLSDVDVKKVEISFSEDISDEGCTFFSDNKNEMLESLPNVLIDHKDHLKKNQPKIQKVKKLNFVQDDLQVNQTLLKFKCNYCLKLFYCKSLYLKHLSIHSKKKRFACSLCNSTFSIHSSLKRHMSVHTGEKNFSCSVCFKKFTRKNGLNRHMITHTGNKPFSCSVCNKTFTRNYILKAHMSMHTDEKPYACRYCKKRFPVKSTLKKHELLHTN